MRTDGILSQAIIKCYREYCVAYVDPEIGNYYYSLIPKYKPKQRQKYPAHITIVRLGAEQASNFHKYDGLVVECQYLPIILECDLYYFLPAYSDTIGNIREDLGLSRFRFGDSYHITVGNKKWIN